MPRSAADGRTAKHTADQAKQIVISQVTNGLTVAAGLKVAQRSMSWYEKARKDDRVFAKAVDEARAHFAATNAKVIPDFPQFSAQYFGQHLFPHQMNMLSVIEGREPPWLHESMIYEPGEMGKRRVLITLPPNHAKTTLMINYVTYRILKDPNISVLLVSRTRDMAAKLLYAIKNRLTHPRYAQMQAKYGPPDGYKASSEMWTQQRIYLGSDDRDSGEKDPTVEALGIGSQIYGARASLVILDDTVTLGNATEWDKQDDWLRQEVSTRLGPGGQIIIVGTRVAPMDLYRHLRDPETYTDGTVPWTYFAMPAVLSYGADDASTQTLWPVGDAPFAEDDEPIGQHEEGWNLYERWSPKRLSRIRNEVGPRRWSLVYQNSDIAEDAVFDVQCIRSCIDGARRPGPLLDREGWHVVIGVDPAIAGQAGLVAYAINRVTHQRMVLDVRSLIGPTPARLREEIFDLVEIHRPHEVSVETNAYQRAIVQDERLVQFLATKGVVLRPQQTGKEKLDPDFGVASMSGLFGTRTAGQVGTPSKHNGDALISLPRMEGSHAVRMLVEELTAWNPEIPVKRRKQDLLMAMWFCEIRAREVIIRKGQGANHFVKGNSFTSARDRKRQVVINLNDYASQMDDRAAWL